MVALLVNILILALILGLVVWIVRVIGVPAPFDKIALAIVGLIALVYLLGMLGVLDADVPRLMR